MDALADTLVGTPRWSRHWWYEWKFWTRTWRGTTLSSVLFPIFYLASLGVGVGHLVSAHHGLVEGQTYLHYIAPSLLATMTMQLGEAESLWPVLACIKWIRTYHAAVATPMEPKDIFTGKLVWLATRAFATGIVYTLVIGAFGALHSWWALSLPFIAVLITLAFAAPLVAYAARCESDASFTAIYRFAIIPMFLFSATFFPITLFPGYLRPVVQFIPLYHGVALSRAAAFGEGTLGAITGHVVFLVAMIVVGVFWGRRTLRRRLID